MTHEIRDDRELTSFRNKKMRQARPTGWAHVVLYWFLSQGAWSAHSCFLIFFGSRSCFFRFLSCILISLPAFKFLSLQDHNYPDDFMQDSSHQSIIWWVHRYSEKVPFKYSSNSWCSIDLLLRKRAFLEVMSLQWLSSWAYGRLVTAVDQLMTPLPLWRGFIQRFLDLMICDL